MNLQQVNLLVSQGFSDLAEFSSNYLVVCMLGAFVLAVFLKFIVNLTIKAEDSFISGFEKRVHRLLDKEYEGDNRPKSFFEMTKYILGRTHYELYSLKSKNARRKLDRVSSLYDRMFMFPTASERLVKDTLKQVKYCENDTAPEFQDIAKFVFSTNPYYNRILGYIPLKPLNRLLGILPGLFIVTGILGTFLGISKGLPALRTMDPANIEASKATISVFLDTMSFSLMTSLLGIVLSVATTVINAYWSHSSTMTEMKSSFTLSLQFLFKESQLQASGKVSHETFKDDEELTIVEGDVA